MPYVCSDCDHFESEACKDSACPSCGGRMRFTMLEPKAKATATATLEPPADPAWKDPYVYGYEEVEATWEFRYAQIGVGIAVYLFVWRWGRRAVTLLYSDAAKEMPPEKLATAIGVTMLILSCLAAIGGGAAAAFWAKNWVLQGLGVAGGVLAVPLLVSIVTPPESWPMFLLTLVLTSTLAVAGAFAGHLLVRPTRVVNS